MSRRGVGGWRETEEETAENIQVLLDMEIEEARGGVVEGF